LVAYAYTVYVMGRVNTPPNDTLTRSISSASSSSSSRMPLSPLSGSVDIEHSPFASLSDDECDTRCQHHDQMLLNNIQKWALLVSAWNVLGIGIVIGWTLHGTQEDVDVMCAPFRFFNYSPTPGFLFIITCVDTYPRYGAMVLLIIVHTLVSGIAYEYLSPWNLNTVQDPTHELNMPAYRVIWIVLTLTVFRMLDSILLFYLFMTQVDVILFRLVLFCIIKVWTTLSYLDAKQPCKPKES